MSPDYCGNLSVSTVLCFPLSVALGIVCEVNSVQRGQCMAGCALELIKKPMHLLLAFNNPNAKIHACSPSTVNLPFLFNTKRRGLVLRDAECPSTEIYFLKRPTMILLGLNLDLFDLWYSGLLLFAVYRYKGFTSASYHCYYM